LPQAHREEVISELAAHLEEDYYDARSRGLTDTEAFAIALREVEDWRVLAADIRRTKSEEDEMNARTKSLRLPGMLGLAGTSILLMMLQRLGSQPHLVWFGQVAMSFYWPWLAGLPIFWSCRGVLVTACPGPHRSAAGGRTFTGTCFVLPSLCDLYVGSGS
jgi:hypothetical protein